MNALADTLPGADDHWILASYPPAPALPPAGQTILLRVADKSQTRAVLRQVLAAWSGRPPEQLPLRETARGPRWIGSLADTSLDISLSYCGPEGWIGLLRGGSIGIDAMPVESFAEATEVARHYLGPAAHTAIQQSSDPARAFALAWTELEARLKCMKRDLVEWSPARAEATARCATRNLVLTGARVVALTVAVGRASEQGAHGSKNYA
jgi:hypothetical protein